MGHQAVIRRSKIHHKTSHQVLQMNEVNNDEKSHLLLLHYSGPKGEKLITSMKKTLNKLPNNTVFKSAHSAMRLRYKSNIKTKTEKEDQHDIHFTLNIQKKIVMKTI